MSLNGTFAGIVEDNKDPEKLGRLKVRVPHAYGAIGGVFGAVTTENIPWALPTGLPNGLSQQSGGCDWLPEIGDQVLVRFLDGEPEKPVYEWFMQTQKAATTFKLHQHKPGANGGVGSPMRGAWVRYGHTVEWNETGLILTTSKGYRMLLTDASTVGNDGYISVSTQAGQYLDFDDSTETVTLNVNFDYQINVINQMLAICDSISLQTMTNEIEMISGSYLSFDTVDNVEGTVGAEWKMDVISNTDFIIGGDWTTDVTGSVKDTIAGDWTTDVTGNVDHTIIGDWTTNVTGNSTHTLLGAYQIDVTSSWLANVSASLTLNSAGPMMLTSEAPATLSSASLLTLSSATSTNMSFSNLMLGTGASEPYVLGNQLLDYLMMLYINLQSHVHGGIMPGKPENLTSSNLTSVVPPTPAMLSRVILGR